MDKKEALEFLELGESPSVIVFNKRWQEKFNHFQNVYTNAPTPQLKNIHKKNLEKLDAIKNLFVEVRHDAARDTPPRPTQQSIDSNQEGSFSSTKAMSNDASAIAFLIRHTEGKDSKTYSLHKGKNPVGRLAVDGFKCVVIDDDPYVSRYHSVINIYLKADLVYYEISDNGEFSQGRISKNGTFINGSEQKITKPVLLHEQDTIQIGTTKLMLKCNTKPLDTIVKDVRKTQFIKTVLIADLL